MIKKRERETSLEEIDDTEWDECNEDETYIDSITLTEEEEEDNKKPDSTIRILFFLIYYGLYRFAGMCLNGFVRALAYIYGLNISIRKRVEEYTDSVSYSSAKSTSNLNKIEQAFKRQTQRDLENCICKLPPGYKKKGLEFISNYKDIQDNEIYFTLAMSELNYKADYQTIHPFNFTNVVSGRLKTVYFCYDLENMRKDLAIKAAKKYGYTYIEYMVYDYLYKDNMKVIIYSFLFTDEKSGYELSLDIWDYFVDRVEDDEYIYQYTVYRTEINGLDIHSLVKSKYEMHEINKDSLNIRLVFEDNNNELPVKKKRL
ncbi:hypothetical protein [Enterobacter asburiae]|uniref:hypothetical protein n=1 Tax=Enterobacter asburiae TaxID=61645 RepID=UPI003F436C06|nr:hypothetical protein [Escherichia coli]